VRKLRLTATKNEEEKREQTPANAFVPGKPRNLQEQRCASTAKAQLAQNDVVLSVTQAPRRETKRRRRNRRRAGRNRRGQPSTTTAAYRTAATGAPGQVGTPSRNPTGSQSNAHCSWHTTRRVAPQSPDGLLHAVLEEKQQINTPTSQFFPPTDSRRRERSERGQGECVTH